MVARSSKNQWKKRFTMLLAGVLAVGGLPAAWTPQADAATPTPVGPGGVGSGLVSWIDVGNSKSAIKDSNNKITKLQDLAPLTREWVTTSNAQASYQSSAINFNPGMLIQNSWYNTDEFGLNDAAREVFSVQTSNYTGSPWEFGGSAGENWNQTTNPDDKDQYGANNGTRIKNAAFTSEPVDITTIDKNVYDLKAGHLLNVKGSSGEWALSLDGKQLSHKDSNVPKWSSKAAQNSKKYYIGASHFSVLNGGSVSEVILYNKTLTDEERTKINSYLALKYGLTLKSTAGEPVVYLDSQGTEIWKSADNGYGHRITGIGRDAQGGLDQKQSRSQDIGANITMTLGDSVAASNQENTNMIASDRSFFMFGDNGKGTNFIYDGPWKRMDRVYQVQKTNWQDTDITLKIDEVQEAKNWPLQLVVSSDDHFDANDSVYPIQNGTIKLNTSALDQNAYFTIAAWVPVPESAVLKQTDTGKNNIVLTFSRDIALTDLTDFTITVDGQEVTADSFAVDPNNAKNLILTLPDLASPLDDVKVSYKGQGNLNGIDSVPVDRFEMNVESEFEAALKITEPAGDTATVSKPAIKGEAEAGSAVAVVVKDVYGVEVPGAGGPATIDANGNWTFEPGIDLADGSYTFEVTASKGSETATKTKGLTLTIPETNLTIDKPSGQTVTDPKPEFKGTADPGSEVTAVIKNKDGQVVGTPKVTLNPDGTWSFMPETDLPDGEYTVEVTAVKNGKPHTESKTFTVNTASNAALAGLQLFTENQHPVELSPAFDSGTYNYTVTNVTYDVYVIPTLSSIAGLDPNAKIEISVNDGPAMDATNGLASDILPLNEGPNKIVIKVTANGKESVYTINVMKSSGEDNNVPGDNGGGDNNGSNGGGSSTEPVPTPAPEPKGNLEVTLNGTSNPFATGTTSTSGDRTVTSVKVDPNKLNDVLSQGKDQKLAIHSPNEGDLKVDGLTADTLKKLAEKGASLDISNPLAIYPVPGGKMDLNGVSKQLGNAALNDIAVHIDIARSSNDLIQNAKNKAASAGYELLVTPVDLDLTFTKDGKTVRSGQLNGYAPKYIALPEGIDPNRITTGVIVNPDGSVYHVPTVVTKIDHRYYALINDLRSSGSYSVIWNPKNFDDVQYHWGRADVNNIAARLDLKGNGNNTFSPNRNVTRSEFADIVVMGLGLMRQDAPQNIFPDVADSAWYRASVAIANEFGIVRGYNDGKFYGNQEMTREQGFSMIARAYRLIDPKAEFTEAQAATVLAGFKDAADVSAWAKGDVAQLIAAGIIQGNGPEVLSPKAPMTRAEVTALIARMLKATDLIDK
ncbi:MAG TPA: S-layer homology domain-containing protein [Paenibacillus cookii]|nr:S-layer homology domain-containing protein [Paenibacillus cookii]